MASATAPSGKSQAKKSPSPSKKVVQDQASNEFVFAVVGHVGSGTSAIANTLKGLLESQSNAGGSFDVTIIKAREVIEDWAGQNQEPLPSTAGNDVKTTEAFQDLGDKMRSSGDYAIVAQHAIQRIRRLRARKQNLPDPGNDPVPPDGKRRAYILDSVRHPAEVELLRKVYQEAFVLIGVVCEAKVRLARLVKKFANAGEPIAKQLMERDARASQKHGQHVSNAFHMADFFVDNTVSQYREDETSNPEWDINERLSRLIKIMTHAQVVRPTMAETAMHAAYGASLRSACLSRQVGAALVDGSGNLVATGTNEVPRAGGGVYGEHFHEDAEDHRCAYRAVGKFCSSTKEQNKIIDEIFEEIPELAQLDNIQKATRKLQLRNSRVGDLIEFSRAVHAEMDALFSAARKGISTEGTHLFVTTFPCHFCARGIVTAGVDEVQYIEPYPKSLALTLHADAITVDGRGWKPPSKDGNRVKFIAFTGVAPRLYRRAFLKDRNLKNGQTGEFAIGPVEWGTPFDVHRISYVELEAALAKSQ